MKAVLQVALLHRVRSSRGIELIRHRHAVASAALDSLRDKAAPSLIESHISLEEGNFFHVDLSCSTIIYVNSLALANETLLRLAEKLSNELPRGALVATLKALESPGLAYESSVYLQMTFGSVPTRVLLYIRTGRSRATLLRKLKARALCSLGRAPA